MAEKYPLVSVVIPVYNSASTLEECLLSVVQQDYSFLEIVVVNDCSTDGSQQIIDAFANVDSRFVCCVKAKNEGLVRARQTGIENAHGKYIQYLDSDDTLCEGIIRLLVDKAEQTQADMVVAPFYFVENGKKSPSLFFNFDELSGFDYLRGLMTWKGHFCVWSKFHLRSLYNYEIDRPDISLGEDVILSFQLLYHSKKVVCLHEEVVNYRISPISMSHPLNMDEKKYKDFKGYSAWVEHFIAQNGLTKEFISELDYFRVKMMQMVFGFRKLEDVEESIIHTLPILKKTPELWKILNRRERKVLRYYKIAPCLGLWRLKSYYKSNKL